MIPTASVAASYVARSLSGVRVLSNLPPVADAAAVSPFERIVGTHDGSFHCDEVLATALLRSIPDYKSATIVRTRVPDILDRCDIVVDVGGVYDESRRRFDHHQKEFHGTMRTPAKEYKTRLSSAGLVYKHFGREVISHFLAYLVEVGHIPAPLAEPQQAILFDRVYKSFVEHVDGIDNGVEEFAAPPSSAADGAQIELVRNYTVSTTLSARVGRFNPRWNAPQVPGAENSAFASAMHLAATEFFDCVEMNAASWLPAYSMVKDAFDAATSVHPSGRIMVLAASGPWKEHLYDVERQAGQEGKILYVLFPDGSGGGRVQCVSKENASFANRKSLPWKGLRDSALSEASGIEGCVFVHVTGFIGGNKSLEGAKQMAFKALEYPEEA